MRNIVGYFILLVAFPASGLAQSVTGTIKSAATGLPLESVSIEQAKGGKTILSAPDGKYSFTGASGNTVVFSYTGYERKEIVFDSLLINPDVSLTPGANALD